MIIDINSGNCGRMTIDQWSKRPLGFYLLEHGQQWLEDLWKDLREHCVGNQNGESNSLQLTMDDRMEGSDERATV
jgi:hypothetical protein